jgi:hypothetical protein
MKGLNTLSGSPFVAVNISRYFFRHRNTECFATLIKVVEKPIRLSGEIKLHGVDGGVNQFERDDSKSNSSEAY